MSNQDPDINVIARWALHNAMVTFVEDEGWEAVPDIGEYDYDRVVECMAELLPPDVTFAEFEVAYKFLADRAENADEG